MYEILATDITYNLQKKKFQKSAQIKSVAMLPRVADQRRHREHWISWFQENKL